MSLRDQLLAKGLVSKKDADRVNRELREQRKAAQGSREAKAEQERAEKQRAEAEAAAKRAAHEAARKAHAEAQAAHEAVYRVRQIVLGNRMAARGPVPFHHRVHDGARIGRLQVKEELARDLRNGDAAIASLTKEAGGFDYVVVTRRAAEKLAELAPERLLHWSRDAGHLGDPSESLLLRTWESQLGPHRVRDEAELRARQAQERARPIRRTVEEARPAPLVVSRPAGPKYAGAEVTRPTTERAAVVAPPRR
jgi:uncharacterized protein YaiL (DUF2058 family)